jgi:murein L,D-transpeptidase YafK
MGAPVFIRIFKEESSLELWLQERSSGKFKLLSQYPICYFSGDLGPKQRTGDGQSPEGFYSVPPGSLNPYSDYHLSFNLGYPNAFDRAKGRTGSALMVHGGCVSIGCYAMTDDGIEEIYTLASAALRDGQSAFQVHIFPFRMTSANLARHRHSEWLDFWSNLKEGYDLFERDQLPPRVTVRGGRYSFTRG